MGFDWYASNDTDPAGTALALSTTAGTPSAAVELHAWLNKGSSVGSPETRYLRVYVEDGGEWKTSGLDCLDRREFEVRIIGSQNPDLVGGFVCPTTAWTPIGTRRTFPLPAIYPNCAIEIEVRVNPSLEGGASSPVTFAIKAIQGLGELPVSIPNDVSVDGDLDMGGYGFLNAILAGNLNANGKRITGVPMSTSTTDPYDVPSWGAVMARPAKGSARACASADVTWPNAVTNGDFASDLTGWTGSGWSWLTGGALHTAGATAPLSQSLAIVAGVTYRLSIGDVAGTAGTVTPSLGAVSGTPIAAGAGVVTQLLVAGATGTLALAFTPSSDFDGTMDDILVEPLNFGLITIDDVALADGDRALLAAGPLPGKWIVRDAAPWERHPDCAASYYLYAGCSVWVTEGTAEANSDWVQYGTFASQLWAKRYQVP